MKRVYVADDDLAILDVVSLILTDEGFTVETSVNGSSLKNLQKDNFPDVIILDISMGAVFGGDICRMLKENNATHYIPVIMLSANPDIRLTTKQCRAVEPRRSCYFFRYGV